MGNHNGRLLIDSTPGQGTCIRLEFPLLEPREGPSVEEDAPGETVVRRLSILLVEDDDVVIEVLHDAIQSFGHDVVQARDVNSALALCRERPFDCVVTDFAMPGRTGRELAEEIRRHYPAMRIVMLSGLANVVRDLEDTHVFDVVLPKPVDFGELRLAILRLFPAA